MIFHSQSKVIVHLIEESKVRAMSGTKMQREIMTGVKQIYRKVVNRIPDSISANPKLLAALDILPKNYEFEVPKVLWRIQESGATRVGLQMPEGLLMFATTIADIIKEFAGVEVVIMGDVTYGACCVDDFTARRVGVDFLVHYGHSCLVPIDVTKANGVTVVYVFVGISFDETHLLECVQANFPPKKRLALASTVQFLTSLHRAGIAFSELGYEVDYLHLRPLSKGEVLGCTAAKIDRSADALLYVGDGRFHLEAAMIANPSLPAYKYDPYSKKFTKEEYDYGGMMAARKNAIESVAFHEGTTVGVILGTLGRQGNPGVLRLLVDKAEARGCRTVVYLMSEIFPDKLKLCKDVDVWVQVACPRLSIDWGGAFAKPILTPYEAAVAMGLDSWKEAYPMDFYAQDSLGKWTPNHKCGKKEKTCACAS